MTPFEQLKALLTAIGIPYETTHDSEEFPDNDESKKDTVIVLRAFNKNIVIYSIEYGYANCYILFRKDGTFKEIDVVYFDGEKDEDVREEDVHSAMLNAAVVAACLWQERRKNRK